MHKSKESMSHAQKCVTRTRLKKVCHTHKWVHTHIVTHCLHFYIMCTSHSNVHPLLCVCVCECVSVCVCVDFDAHVHFIPLTLSVWYDCYGYFPLFFKKKKCKFYIFFFAKRVLFFLYSMTVMYTCTYVHLHDDILWRICACTYIYICIYICIYIHILITSECQKLCQNVKRVRIRNSACIFIYLYVYVYTYIYICIYIHIQKSSRSSKVCENVNRVCT